jgi:thiamine monophosphate synthase
LIAITAAKKILSKDAIVGISASTVEEAVKAVEEGADYLGIGTLFATPTLVSGLIYEPQMNLRNLTAKQTPKT